MPARARPTSIRHSRIFAETFTIAIRTKRGRSRAGNPADYFRGQGRNDCGGGPADVDRATKRGCEPGCSTGDKGGPNPLVSKQSARVDGAFSFRPERSRVFLHAAKTGRARAG